MIVFLLRILYAGIIAFSLASCVQTAASSKGHMLQYMAGPTKREAFLKANKSCNEYGRAAEVEAYDSQGQRLSFRCIEP
jgi:hypothetical protein